MKRSFLLVALSLIFVACSPAGEGGRATTSTSVAVATTTVASPAISTTLPEHAEFPVDVADDLGEVTLGQEPASIVSLSSVATEMLFAIGAGDQVVAVDDQSNYPAEAPMTDLSGFTPNLEAILSFEPDLVVISFDPGELVAGLGAAGVPVLTFGSALSLDDTYRQIEALGVATGQHDEATTLNDQIQADLAAAVAAAPEAPDGTDYYHEIDNTLYTATSSTFIGQIYGMFGVENIADPADADGSAFGFPQLSSEFIVDADPDLIFLANTLYGETAATVAARPGWDVLSAVQDDNIFELDSDVASRWGPRVVDLADSIAAALADYVSRG